MITRVGKEDCERLANAALIAAAEYDREAGLHPVLNDTRLS